MPGSAVGLLRNLVKRLLLVLFWRHRRTEPFALAVALRNRWRGRHVRLDVATICQLKCLACSTAEGLNRKGPVGSGLLDAKGFARFLDANPDVRSVEIANWGEVFLNPDLPAILKAASERGVRLTCLSGANLNRASDEALEALVRYGFDQLSVSIDGASEETYVQYRVGGSFAKVIANVRRINEHKRRLGSDRPHLTWQFVIFGHNEHELPKARRMAEELGMRFQPKLNHDPTVSPIVDPDFVRRESGLGVVSYDEHRETKGEEYYAPCTQLWTEPQVNFDGKLLGCCVNRWGHFGNVFEEGLQSLLSSERYAYAKRMVVGREPPRDDQPCVQCPVFQRLQAARAERAEPAPAGGG